MYLGYPRQDYAIFTTDHTRDTSFTYKKGRCVCLNKCNGLKVKFISVQIKVKQVRISADWSAEAQW